MRLFVAIVLLCASLAGCVGDLEPDATANPSAAAETASSSSSAAPRSASPQAPAAASAKPTAVAPAAEERDAPLAAELTLSRNATLHTFGQARIVVNKDALLSLNGTVYELTAGTSLLDLPLLGPGHHRLPWMVAVGRDFVEGSLDVAVVGVPLVFPAEPTASHTIRPGILSEKCTTNFIFHHLHLRYFIGSAAHCVDKDANGGSCEATQSRIGDSEALEFGVTGTHAYSSWTSMNRLGVGAGNECDGNDFALIEIDPADWNKIHPKSHGVVGHVTGLGDCRDLPGGLAGTTPTGADVVAYGRSNIRGGVVVQWQPDHPADDKEGNLMAADNGGLSCYVYLATPGVPGDSGGPLSTPDGQALGAASTITLYPTAGSNHYTNIAAALEKMRDYEGWAPELVLG